MTPGVAAWQAPAAAPVAPPPRAPKRGLGFFATVLVAGVTALVVGIVAGLAGYLVGRGVDEAAGGGAAPVIAAPLPQVEGDVSPRADESIAGIAEQVLPSVVSILVEGTRESGSGSGFVIRPDGYIVTNNHVVDLGTDGGGIEVVFANGDSAPATIVGTNASYDLAVLKVNRDDLPTVALGDSEAVKVGDAAIAIGAPLGLDGTVTLGIVSALDRPVTAGDTGSDTSYINAIQTDAAINPGNSGGPLLDGRGAVIGVNSAIATLAIGGEAGNIGLGFAIPVNVAKRIVEELIATGRSSTPIIGVTLDMTYDGGGARVREVTSDGPADAAGIQVGDVIRTVNGRPIEDGTELVVAIRSYAPGDTVSVEFDRGGRESSADIVLGTAKD